MSTVSARTTWRKLIITCELQDLSSVIDETRVRHLLLSISEKFKTVTATIETQFNLKMDFVKAHLLDDKMQLKNRLFINQEVNDNGISFKATSGCFLCGDKIYFGAL